MPYKSSHPNFRSFMVRYGRYGSISSSIIMLWGRFAKETVKNCTLQLEVKRPGLTSNTAPCITMS